VADGDYSMGGVGKLTDLAAGTTAGHSVRYEQVVNSVAGHVAGHLR